MNIWDRHRARFPEKIQSTDGPAFWIFFQVSRIRVKRTGLALYLYLLFYILDKFCLKDPIRKLLKEKNNWINRTENPRKSENFCSSKSQILVSESFLPNITKEEVKKLLYFDEIKGNNTHLRVTNMSPTCHQYPSVKHSLHRCNIIILRNK